MANSGSGASAEGEAQPRAQPEPPLPPRAQPEPPLPPRAQPEPPPGRIGVFVAGALGAVATTAIAGAAAVSRGLAGPGGLVTELPLFRGAGLPSLDRLVFGGFDVREGSPLASATELEADGVLPRGLAAACADVLGEVGARIRPGILSPGARPSGGAAPWAAEGLSPREAVAYVRRSIRELVAQTGVGRAVFVHLASVEPPHEVAEAARTEADLGRLLDSGDPGLPPSLIYALAAIEEGLSYLNFTPSCGATPPAVQTLAERRSVPLAGRDGKTGETLLKSVLAPLFAARHLQVLSWAGYNILGNRDGATLADPAAKRAKLRSKGSVLRQVLGDGGLGTEHTEIAYVPSLGDWKTAWDHVHFAGFLGTRMRLELTWQGCDSALAAPLVLDCVRLLARLHALGRKGPVPELASFFKDPMGCVEQAFPIQWTLLERLAGSLGTAST